jgi:CHAD domain-containing protein
VARRRLDRLRGRLLEEAAFFSALPATRRHHVRIRAKRLRYAIELLSGEFAADAVRPWTERLEALQDLLGAANDAAVASTTLRGLAVADATRRRAQRAARQRIQGSLIRTERALLQLAQAVPPWHAGPVPANPRSGEVPAV